jgi:hypothetical protein
MEEAFLNKADIQAEKRGDWDEVQNYIKILLTCTLNYLGAEKNGDITAAGMLSIQSAGQPCPADTDCYSRTENSLMQSTNACTLSIGRAL